MCFIYRRRHIRLKRFLCHLADFNFVLKGRGVKSEVRGLCHMCNKGTKGHNILVPREEPLIISTCLPPLWAVRSLPYSSFHQYLKNFLLKSVRNFVWDCSNLCIRIWQSLCSSLHHFELKIPYYISVLNLTADSLFILLPWQLDIKMVNAS
jgi:hypothetical protein